MGLNFPHGSGAANEQRPLVAKYPCSSLVCNVWIGDARRRRRSADPETERFRGDDPLQRDDALENLVR